MRVRTARATSRGRVEATELLGKKKESWRSSCGAKLLIAVVPLSRGVEEKRTGISGGRRRGYLMPTAQVLAVS